MYFHAGCHNVGCVAEERKPHILYVKVVKGLDVKLVVLDTQTDDPKPYI